MLYDFRFNIILRIVILLSLVAAFVLSLEKNFFLTTGFVGVLLVITVINLIYYVNQTNRDLASFFASVQYNDFTTTSSAGHRGETFGELYDGFNMINRKFQDMRMEKEANHQFLHTIVEHINIGLLCIDKDNNVILMNRALQHVIRKSYLINIDGIKQVNEDLWEIVNKIKGGERELIKLNIDNKLLQLAIQAVELRLKKEPFRLISFQNIQTELEEQELVAWQKLIRILTHEIMNSVAPIASLSSTIKDIIQYNDSLEPDVLGQIKNSVGVIQKRSEGLLDFTETYRSLTRIPPPKFQLINGKELIMEMETLFKPELEKKNINLEMNFPPGRVEFQGDPGLLEQVLINLVKNAMDALEETESPIIQINLQKQVNDKALIQVVDNGPGISEEMLEQIFVPFYTTKDHGSGIGLSLSRQIMRMHKGSIEVQSAEGKGTMINLVI